MVKFKELERKIGFAVDDYNKKIEVLKTDYPAFYIAHCRYYNRQDLIDDYMNECL